MVWFEDENVGILKKLDFFFLSCNLFRYILFMIRLFFLFWGNLLYYWSVIFWFLFK